MMWKNKSFALIILILIFGISEVRADVNFTSPTLINGSITNLSFVEINASISMNSLNDVKYHWNGINYTIYNDSLLIMMNFENLSSLGENSTKVVDISKYSNNGSCSGITCPRLNQTGRFGKAYTFDGVDDYIDAGNFADNLSNFTVSAWFRSLTCETTYSAIVTKVNLNGNGWGMYFSPWGGGGCGNVWFITEGESDSTWASRYTDTYYNDGNWHQATVIVTNKNNIQIYIDGENVSVSGSNGGVVVDMSISNNVRIGGDYDNDYFNGSIDEVRIWNRSLSPEETYESYVTNLQKFNQTQWNLYVNQSKVSTNILDNGNYSYFISAKNSSGSENISETRFVTVNSSEIPNSITGCMVLNSQNKYYTLINDINNDTITDNCFNISVSGITLDCNGHSIRSIQNFSGVYSDQLFLTVKNCNISMGSGGNSNSAGIVFISGSDNGTIFNNTIYGDMSTGIYINSDFDNVSNNFVNLTGNGIGIQTYYASYFFIYNNFAESNTNTGIYISGGNFNSLIGNLGISKSDVGIGMLFANGIISNNNTGIGDNWPGIDINGGDNITSINDYGKSNSGTGNLFEGGGGPISNLTVKNCTGRSDSGTGLKFSGPDDMYTVINCTGISNSGNGIEFSGVVNASYVTGITNESSGIVLYASNSTFSNVRAEGRLAGSLGFFIFGYSNNVIKDCINISGYDIDVGLNYNGDNINNSFINCSYNKTKESVDTNTQLIRKWYLDVNVSNSTGALNGALVNASNVSSSLQFSGLTDNTGFIPRKILTEYVNNGTTRSYYSPYTMNVTAFGYDDYGNNSLNMSGNVRWNVSMQISEGGVSQLGLSLIYPNVNLLVDQNSLFNITLNLTCLSGNCGSANVSLLLKDSSPLTNITNGDFETGNLNGWTTGGNSSWTAQSGTKYEGSYAAASGAVANYQNSWMKQNITLLEDANITFMWKVNGGLFNYLGFCVDKNYGDDGCSSGSADKTITGNIDWIKATYNLKSGNHTILWYYNKYIFSGGSEKGWVDNITIDYYRNYPRSYILLNSSGNTPFYTNISNPLTSTSLNQGQSQSIVFIINATGNPTHKYSFFGFTNLTTNFSISNTTSSWNVTINDITLPTINITYPLSRLYYQNIFRLNYTVTDDVQVKYCWYTNDSGITNSSLVNAGVNFTNVPSKEGTNNWTVYCNDSTGNINSASIIFSKDTITTNVSTCREIGADNLVFNQISDINQTSDSNCIIFIGQNITYNCNGYKIYSSNGINQAGIYSNQYNTTIKNCNITMGEGGNGVYLETGADHSNIINNSLTNQFNGLLLFYTGNITIINNTMSSNYFGVNFVGSSSDVVSNNLLNNNNEGFGLNDSLYNVFNNNNFNNNYFGFYFHIGSGNNNISGGYINGSRNNALYMTIEGIIEYSNNIISNVTFSNTNSSFYDLDIDIYAVDNTYLVDSKVQSYFFPDYLGARVIFEDTNEGQILFNNYLQGNGTNLSEDIKIGNNSVYVNSTKSGLNVPAVVTLYNIGNRGFSRTVIMRNGNQVCNESTSPSCSNFTSLIASTVIFNVSSWSNYSIMDEDSLNITNVVAINQSGSSGSGSSVTLIRGDNFTINSTVSGITNSTGFVWAKVWQSVVGGNLLWTGFLNWVSGNLWSTTVVTNWSWPVGLVNYTVYANDSIGNEMNLSSNFTIRMGVNLTDCGNLDVANTYYTLMNNVVGNGTCFNITANNVTLDCQGYGINYSNSTWNSHGIFSDKNYTVIKNCIIKNNPTSGWGADAILLYYSFNTLVYNNTIISTSGGSDGIYCDHGGFFSIFNNTISTSQESSLGINVNTINNATIQNNNITTTASYSDFGIAAQSSTNLSFYNNNISAFGAMAYYITGSNPNHFDFILGSDNLVRGLPVNYSKNINNLNFNNLNGSDFGQIIIFNSVNVSITNSNLSNYGLSLFYVNDSLISNNNFSTHGTSIYSYPFGLSHNITSNNINSLGQNSFGIYISGVPNSTINNNNITGVRGIYLGSSNNSINDNMINVSSIGISICSSSNTIKNLNIVRSSNPIASGWCGKTNLILIDSYLSGTTNSISIDYISANSSIRFLNVSFNKSNTYINERDVYLENSYYLDINVTNSSGQLDSALVNLSYENLTMIDSNLTPVSGVIRYNVTEYIQNFTGEENKTYFGMYLVNVSKNGYNDYGNNSLNMSGNQRMDVMMNVMSDTVYPSFSLYYDNNGILNGTGTALFNVTVNNTNGTVILTINGANYSANNLSSNEYNISVNLNNGTYNYYWISFGNGASHNINNSESRIYVLNDTPVQDLIYPQFTNAWDNNATLIGSGVARFNVTVTNTNGTVLLSINGSNFTANNISLDIWNYSLELSNGTYQYQWISFGNGTDRNINVSDYITYVVNNTIPQVLYPQFSNYYDNNATIVGSGVAQFNVSIENTNGTVLLAINGTNYSASNLSGNDYNVSLNLNNGTYNYFWISFGNDSNKYQNNSILRSYTVNTSIQDTTPPDFNEIVSYVNVNYSNMVIIDINATDNVNLSGYYINESNLFEINPITGLFYNITSISAETYYSNISVNDTSNNWNYTIIEINILKADSSVRTYINGSESDINIIENEIIWLNGTKEIGEGEIKLYINNVLINQGDNNLENLTLFSSAGYYNMTTIYEESQNYTRSFSTYFINVTEIVDITPPLFTTRPDNITINYGEELLDSFKASDDIMLGNFSINWTNLFEINSTGEIYNITSIAAGNYFINVTINDSSGNTNSTIYEIIVLKANSTVKTYLNGTESNITILNNTILSINGSLTEGDGVIILYINNVLLNSGSSPLSNLTLFYSVGVYNITTIYSGNQNYSSSFETWFINVSNIPDTTPPYFVDIGNINIYDNQSLNYKINASDDHGTVLYSINWTEIFSINPTTGLLTNISQLIIGDHYINITINDSSENLNSTIILISVLNSTLPDTIYPMFSSYENNNGTLNGTGIARFNVTVVNNNGTVLFSINGSNYSASNINGDRYNFSVALSTGTYDYYWISFGNGWQNKINSSVIISYTVNETIYTDYPPSVNLITPLNWINTSNQNLSLIGEFADDRSLNYSNLFLWDSYNETMNSTINLISGISNTSNVTLTIPHEGIFKWNYYVCDNSSQCRWSPQNRTINYDISGPVFNSISNYTIAVNVSFNKTINSTDLSGISYYWLNDSTMFNIDPVLGLLTNISDLSSEGIYWIKIYSNDTLNNTRSIDIYFNITTDLDPPIINFSCTPVEVNIGTTITCNCSASDLLDSNPIVSYIQNPVTTSVGSFFTSCTATDHSLNSNSSNISYIVNAIPETESDSGGGGGGGGSPIQQNITINFGELKGKGERTLSFLSYQILNFSFDGEGHNIKIKKILFSNKTAELEFASNLIILNLSTGERTEIKLFGDNNDFFIVLNEIPASNKITLTIGEIKQEIISNETQKENPITKENNTETKINQTKETIPQKQKKTDYLQIIFITIIVILIIIISVIILYLKKLERSELSALFEMFGGLFITKK